MMRLLITIPLLTVCTAAFSTRQEGQGKPDMEVKTPGGFIRLYNFGNIEVEEGGIIKGSATGNPVTLVDTERGLTLTGKSMVVTLRRIEGGYAVQGADASGGAVVVYDSKVAYEAKAANIKPVPVAPLSFDRTRMTTDAYRYSTEGGKGTLVFPGPLAIEQKSSGASAKGVRFEQALNVDGTKATMVAETTELGQLLRPLSGVVEGPVNFRLDRVDHEVKEGKPVDDTTKITGSTDRLEANLAETEPNLTAVGKVDVNGTGAGFVGKVTGEKAVIFLNETMKPVRYRFVGNPASTRVNVGKGGQ